MSTPTSHDTTSTSSGSMRPVTDTSRDWWYWPRDADGEPVPPEQHEEHSDHFDPNSRSEWIAHRILKSGAELLDPIALREPPNRRLELAICWLLGEDPPEDHDPAALHRINHEVPVTDPIEHVPKHLDRDDLATSEYGVIPHRCRVSKEYGHIVRGPVIADRPTEELLDIVAYTLEAAGPFADRYLSDRERDRILDRAERMKREGDAHDVTIMAEVVRCLEDPNRIE